MSLRTGCKPNVACKVMAGKGGEKGKSKGKGKAKGICFEYRRCLGLCVRQSFFCSKALRRVLPAQIAQTDCADNLLGQLAQRTCAENLLRERAQRNLLRETAQRTCSEKLAQRDCSENLLGELT